MVWYGMVWYGMVWYGMVWYGVQQFNTFLALPNSLLTVMMRCIIFFLQDINQSLPAHMCILSWEYKYEMTWTLYDINVQKSNSS